MKVARSRVAIWLKEEHMDVVLAQGKSSSVQEVKTISNREKSFAHWVKRNKGKGRATTVAIDQSWLEMRLLQVPDVSTEEIEKIIGFELQQEKKKETSVFHYQPIYCDKQGNQVVSVLSCNRGKVEGVLHLLGKEGLKVDSVTTIAQGLVNYIGRWEQIENHYCLVYLEGARSLLIFVIDGKLAYVHPWEFTHKGIDQLTLVYTQTIGFLQRQYDFPAITRIKLLDGEGQDWWVDEEMAKLEQHLGVRLTIMEPNQFNQQAINQWAVLGLLEQEEHGFNLIENINVGKRRYKVGVMASLLFSLLLGISLVNHFSEPMVEESIPVIAQEESMNSSQWLIGQGKLKGHELLGDIYKCWQGKGDLEEVQVEGAVVTIKGSVENYHQLGQLGERLNQLSSLSAVIVKESYRLQEEQLEQIKFTLEGELVMAN